MTGHEKYEIYCEMFEKAHQMMEEIRNGVLTGEKALWVDNHRINKVQQVFDVFIAVGDEENRKYFIDMEYKNCWGEYHRLRGNYTLELKKVDE